MHSILQGRIKKIQSFGAFVSIDDFRKGGLIYVTQLSYGRVSKVSECVKHGQDVCQVWVAKF